MIEALKREKSAWLSEKCTLLERCEHLVWQLAELAGKGRPAAPVSHCTCRCCKGATSTSVSDQIDGRDEAEAGTSKSTTLPRQELAVRGLGAQQATQVPPLLSEKESGRNGAEAGSEIFPPLPHYREQRVSRVRCHRCTLWVYLSHISLTGATVDAANGGKFLCKKCKRKASKREKRKRKRQMTKCLSAVPESP